MAMPPLQHAVSPGVPSLVPGPDVIVGDVEDVAQFDAPVDDTGWARNRDRLL